MNDALAAFLDLGWSCLECGAVDAEAPARFPCLATVSPEGWPEARSVALRRADRPAGELEVHTDPASDKVAALRANPRAALHIWEPTLRLQLRLSVTVALLTGEAARNRWDDIPDEARRSYGKTPRQGAVIPGPFSYEITAAFEDFAVLLCRLHQIDLVELHENHRRATYQAENDWAGDKLGFIDQKRSQVAVG